MWNNKILIQVLLGDWSSYIFSLYVYVNVYVMKTIIPLNKLNCKFDSFTHTYARIHTYFLLTLKNKAVISKDSEINMILSLKYHYH